MTEADHLAEIPPSAEETATRSPEATSRATSHHLAGECADLASEAAVELDRLARDGRATSDTGPGGPSLSPLARGEPVAEPAQRRYPDDLRPSSTTISRVRFTESARPRGSTRRCATRCSRGANGSARCSLSRPRARWPRPEPPADGRGDRVDPHVFADPRRPARDGRRRARRGRPTCHIAFGENVAILAGDGLFAEATGWFFEQSGGSARTGAGGASRAFARDQRRRHGRRPVRRRHRAPTTSTRPRFATCTAEDRATDRRQHRVAPLLLGASEGSTIALAPFAGSLASCSRLSTTSST